MNNSIDVINAQENNLKNVNVSIPKNVICGICGVSGSGKSTLVRSVIANYALNNFALSMPVYLKRKLALHDFPNVQEVKNVPPVILIDIKTANRSNRSTVATTSGLMSILRNMFASCGSIENDRSNKEIVKVYPRLFSYNILTSNGGGACEHCLGSGKEDSILIDNLMGDGDKSIFDGGFSVINNNGILYTKITDLFIRAFCQEYNIDINKKVKDLSEEELNLLLHGSDKIISFTDKSGANNGRKKLKFPGIINALLEVYGRTKNINIEKLIVSIPCSYCMGSRFNKVSLQYKLNGKTIADYLAMNIMEILNEMEKINSNIKLKGFTEEFLTIARELVDIGVGYLELNREVATISGGELQRVKLAKQIAMKLKGYCYVIDEPTTGLHNADIVELIKSLRKLKSNGNTILVVEHNPLFLKNCDYLIELGEGGGSSGGRIIAKGTPQELMECNTLTGEALRKNISLIKTSKKVESKKIILRNINVNNLKNVSISVPMHSFVSVAGVSGSGKSSAINNALYTKVKKYLDLGKNENDNDLIIEDEISDIIRLDQNASVLNSRSNVATLLGIMDYIREMYAGLEESKKAGFDSKVFSKNSEVGTCLVCNGLGYIKVDEGLEEECLECEGIGYSHEVLDIRFKNYNIHQLMNLNINELVDIIEDKRIKGKLIVCCDIGLSYLSLNRKSPTLSKGEYQRLRIVNEICKNQKKNSIFILDEPSKGLHIADAMRIVDAIKVLVKEGHTVIAIEHNLDVIMHSDYVLEFGPFAGDRGGMLVFSGTPSELINANTLTSKVLKEDNIDLLEDSIDSINNINNLVEVKSDKYNFVLDMKKTNVLRGYVGSGKTILLEKLLYANPLKKYISCISTQGKYLTRDIEAIKNEGCALPLARIVSDNRSFFGKNERVMETLNLNHLLKILFYKYGKKGKNLNTECFNVASHVGKCSICQGNGRILSYDFEKLLQSDEMSEDLRCLLNDRSRISRIQPLLKANYGIDISKNYYRMSDEEKRIYIFGDKLKEVYYAPKKKKYIWEGCNKILFTNLEYATVSLQEFIKPTYKYRKCSYCFGTGTLEKVRVSTYKTIMYEEFLNKKIKEIYERLTREEELGVEESRFIQALKKMIDLGLGDLSLGDYTISLDSVSRLLIQYLSYRFNPLNNTLILIDDFAITKNNDVINNLIQDFKLALNDGMSTLVVDNNLVNDCMNEIGIESEKITAKEDLDYNHDYGCFIVSKYDGEIINRREIEISKRSSVGSVTEVIPKIRNIFKKSYKEYNFTGMKEEEKCPKCHGLGYYEINLGDIGYSKCKCMECHGTGFSEEILSSKVNGLSMGDILNMPLKDLIVWLNEIGLKDVLEKLKLFEGVGLEKISLSQTMENMSYNEISLMIIAMKLAESEKVAFSNFFINVKNDEMSNILSRLNKQAKILHKNIILL